MEKNQENHFQSCWVKVEITTRIPKHKFLNNHLQFNVEVEPFFVVHDFRFKID